MVPGAGGYPELAVAPKSGTDAGLAARLWGLSAHLTGTDGMNCSGRGAG